MDDDRAGPVGPVPLSLLADLQAGLLDDGAAARLRHRARTDVEVADQLAALDRVRRDVAALGVDAASAPEVPADVTARIVTALKDLPAPNHRLAATRGPVSRWRGAAAGVGLAAALAAVGVGSSVLLRDAPRGTSVTGATASSIAMTGAPGGVPLSDEEILALVSRPAELGPLASAQRLASCLSGLGYPASTSPLGARPLAVHGRPGVLLLLAGDLPKRINAVVVAPTCSSVDTGLLASTVVNRS